MTPDARKSAVAGKKAFAVPAEKVEKLIASMGGCYATDRVMVDGLPVGYMYRECPDGERDSGWRFFAGDESSDYVDEPSHIGMYDVNTVANYDPDIIPYLQTPPPCAFEKISATRMYRPLDKS
jgi:hypothetical protein